jgi:hypothetical protein
MAPLLSITLVLSLFTLAYVYGPPVIPNNLAHGKELWVNSFDFADLQCLDIESNGQLDAISLAIGIATNPQHMFNALLKHFIEILHDQQWPKVEVDRDSTIPDFSWIPKATDIIPNGIQSETEMRMLCSLLLDDEIFLKEARDRLRSGIYRVMYSYSSFDHLYDLRWVSIDGPFRSILRVSMSQSENDIYADLKSDLLDLFKEAQEYIAYRLKHLDTQNLEKVAFDSFLEAQRNQWDDDPDSIYDRIHDSIKDAVHAIPDFHMSRDMVVMVAWGKVCSMDYSELKYGGYENEAIDLDQDQEDAEEYYASYTSDQTQYMYRTNQYYCLRIARICVLKIREAIEEGISVLSSKNVEDRTNFVNQLVQDIQLKDTSMAPGPKKNLILDYIVPRLCRAMKLWMESKRTTSGTKSNVDLIEYKIEMFFAGRFEVLPFQKDAFIINLLDKFHDVIQMLQARYYRMLGNYYVECVEAFYSSNQDADYLLLDINFEEDDKLDPIIISHTMKMMSNWGISIKFDLLVPRREFRKCIKLALTRFYRAVASNFLGEYKNSKSGCNVLNEKNSSGKVKLSELLCDINIIAIASHFRKDWIYRDMIKHLAYSRTFCRSLHGFFSRDLLKSRV